MFFDFLYLYVYRYFVVRILGNRILELEKKIKILEVVGFWNISSKIYYFLYY